LNQELRAKILKSRLLPILVFPYRFLLMSRHLFCHIKLSLAWLCRSREFANFTYDLTPANKHHLAWFISGICNVPVQEIESYFLELESNNYLRQHIETHLRANRRGKEINGQAFFGRRLGWYAIVRSIKPALVVETGTEKGLGSLVIADALIRNGGGRLVTVDIESQSGLLLGGIWARVIEHLVGDSLAVISRLGAIDLFIHDSDHSPEHELREIEQVAPVLSATGIVLSDNSHVTSVLSEWSSRHNRQFSFFAEKPLNHWYSGAGIGVSVKKSMVQNLSQLE